MKVNDLVVHRHSRTLGIGCVSKVLRKNLKVNFGTQDVLNVRPADLNLIDVSSCKTVTFGQYKRRVLVEKSNFNKAIVGNEIMEFVGIGWISIGVVQEEDLTKYPRVI